MVTNRKAPERRGKVQLVDAREYFVKMRKSLGEKRKEISSGQIDEITRLYGGFAESEKVKIFPNEAFGFLRITVERPLRLRWEVTDETTVAVMATKAVQKLPDDEQAALRELLEKHRGTVSVMEQELRQAIGPALNGLDLPGPARKAVYATLAVRDEDAPGIADRKGNPESDPDLRDNENVPLPAVSVSFGRDPAERFATLEYRTAVSDYMRGEILPYAPDAWVENTRTKIGYEIPLTRHFYKYAPPRPLEEIDGEIKTLEDEIQRLLAEVAQ